MRGLPILLPAVLAAATFGATTAAAPALSGTAIYARCAACHTASGKGIPNVFPPLAINFRKLAAKPAGRRYLVLALAHGLNGVITVEGKLYRGVMPAQAGMNDAAIVAVLNHIGTTIAKAGPPFRPFTASEVAKARASGVNLSGADVAKLRGAVDGG